MKSKLIILFFACVISTALFAKDKKDGKLRYDIENVGQEGAQRSYLVRAWIYSSSANVSIDLIKEAAIRGVIFKGYAGSPGVQGQRPLATDPATEEEKADFFSLFFSSGGEYLRYATALEDSYEVIKLGKKEYKIGMVVSVAKDDLRKALETANVIRSLSSGF
ncbi:hypothetical protein LJC35_03870 [Parabacteroides sp. OttesenSCG-928-N08]|nr:hypothetical protein [Parabacteroides sp. OttesenSCG-928-N08]